MIRTITIQESPIIGAFATCTEDIVLVPQGTPEPVREKICKFLKANVVETLINGSTIVGSLCRGNSNAVLVPMDSNIRGMDLIDVPVVELPSKLNAVGNVVLANDSAALVHPELSDRSVEAIEKALKVDVKRGTIGGAKTVGMAGVATNKGLLVNPRATSTELEVLEELFGLPVDIGTSNYGTQMVGSGLIANSKGYVAGSQTTGHELGRIEDALDLLE
ncbi:translation initiation factor 6 (aeIF-6) [Methanolobus vulcani]|jgi:translation initiation factor 6|uniref:Translation initiation factor 6 n=1 Tax=Methanolobus vulcani TaxID=38026 RepID=A0A7Z7FBI3_9EURY|nr:translation initiation factor IF-6 [Methanolobus vulcani]MDK2826558.1 translation initiation factor 6 [Methanolobus sp.]SDF21659.1 translation initiation factor 6 (aeIF-6) [Methanolobus vulcani]